jgi:hypothetical protein
MDVTLGSPGHSADGFSNFGDIQKNASLTKSFA